MEQFELILASSLPEIMDLNSVNPDKYPDYLDLVLEVISCKGP